ncbi:MAG: ATP synthase F1 subunit delta [Christensenellales bacterium]
MTELGRAYGGALYALAEDEQLENELLTQLDEVCKLLADNPNYVRLIKDKAIAKAERLTLLDGAFGGRIHPYLLNFMKLLCERGAFGEMPACRAEYVSCYNNKHGIIPVKVISAEPLSETQLARLKEALERKSGKHVKLDLQIDAALGGGLRVEMAGKCYDNTLESRMDHLRRALAARS